MWSVKILSIKTDIYKVETWEGGCKSKLFKLLNVKSKAFAWSVYKSVSNRGTININKSTTIITFFNVISPNILRILLYFLSIYYKIVVSSISMTYSLEGNLWSSFYFIKSSYKWGRFILTGVTFYELPF